MAFEVACDHFGNYHRDARNERLHGLGWCEWELVKRAEPRLPGMRQPRVPLWRYDDEADPRDMARKIDAAADQRRAGRASDGRAGAGARR